MLRNFLVLFPFLVLLVGCPQYVIRDEASVRMDYVMLQKISAESAEHIWTQQVSPVCQCANGKWVGIDCEKAAKMVLFLKIRFPWHMEMMLFNSGLTEARPSEMPPVVPPPESLCPGVPVTMFFGGSNG